MIFLLKCPKCKHNMKYQSESCGGKRKQCVYCGRSFSVNTNLLRKIK